ncbi:hypothetical protein IP88_16340 [alpha proteobacterium AAP81b]|nr:hypothetical protein IP88_16340 [alpha proteobacterium AAP81b]
MIASRRLAAVAGLALLTGCRLGPDYRPPATPATAAGAFVSASPTTASADAPPPQWWRLYDDPVLDDLIAQAFAANTDLRVATANLRRARAVLTEARAANLPATTTTASFAEARQTIGTVTGPRPFSSELYRLGFDMSYELDLYGRVRRSIEAARADAAAEAAARDTVAIGVAAETARAYADACSGAAQLAVAERSLKIQSDSFAITERRVAVGRDSPLDVARARAQVEATRATIPDFTAARQSALFRLAVLTGKPPAEIDPRAAACAVPPRLLRPLPVGDGTALLARRPDVRQADRRFAAAGARIGVAKADYFPRITLGAAVTGTGITPEATVSSNGFGYSFGPQISWTFPNFAAVRARVRQNRANAEAAIATFDGTVLTALRETETALSDYANGLDRNAALRSARDQSAEAARIVRLRYGAGSAGFLDVLDAERTLATADAQLAASDAALTTLQVAVFRALGGGWETLPPVARVAPVTRLTP